MAAFTNALRTLAARHGYYIRKMDCLSPLESLLHSRLARSPDFFFVQIGANDGILCDAIFPFITRFNLAGLVVEPLPDVFEVLKQTYRQYPRVKPVNVALHRTAAHTTLYRADPAADKLFDHARGIVSFDRNHLRRFGIPDECIRAVEVPCMTLQQLLDTHSVRHIDLLQIDTEGYDIEIVKMIDFDRIKPTLLRFEHGLPDDIVSWETLQSTLRYLHDRGYLFLLEPYDVTAYQPESWLRVLPTASPKTAP